MKRPKWAYVFSILIPAAISVAAFSADETYQNTMLNISACGGTMSGDRYVNFGSLVSVGGEGMRSATFYNHSGFSAGFILQPNTAFSCLSDEWNPDNDLDGLDDSEEIAAGSSLYSSDTDGDGMGDFDELIAGTSLTNSNSILALDLFMMPDGKLVISWFGVNDRAYIFEYSVSLSTNEWQSYPFEIGGSDSTIIFIDDSSVVNSRFYRVRVRHIQRWF